MFITAAIAAAIAGASGFALAWRLQSATILEMTNDAQQTRILAQRVARATIERTTSAVITAQNNAASRVAGLRADADASRAGLDGLRTSTAAAMRAASGSLDACNQSAAALGVVQSLCATELQALAERCDGHVSDLTLMREAWPK